MAAAMNKMGYDAAALGNHEFNYGLDTLRAYESQLDFPLLGANAVDPATKRPVFRPYVIKKYRVAKGRKPLKIGILGLVTPGVAIWDKANVQGKVEFPGLVEQAAKYVPELKKKGCDLVVVSAHSGADTSSSYGDALPYPENAASLVAAQVPDIDAILVGHAHKEIPQRFVTNTRTGKQVLLCEPYYWGMRLAVMNLTVEWQRRKRRWKLVRSHSQLLNSNTAKENGRRLPGGPRPARQGGRLRQLADRHVDRRPVGGPGRGRGRADHRLRPVRPGPGGQGRAHRRRRHAAGALDRGAVQPHRVVPGRRGERARRRGPLHLRQHAAGGEDHRCPAQGLPRVLRALLQEGGCRHLVPDGRRHQRGHAGCAQRHARLQLRLRGRAGQEADLQDRHRQGRPTRASPTSPTTGRRSLPTQQFALAVNNYRQSGGGGFPAVSTAPVVYNQQVEIRQLLIDWVTANHVVDPTTFASVDWKLVNNGADITIT